MDKLATGAMFSIEAKFSMQNVSAIIEKRTQDRIDSIVEYLRGKGKEYTEIARNKTLASNPYTNRTFNLVSSVGFCMVYQGRVLESYFPLMDTGTEGKAKGEATGEQAATELAGNDVISLVLVAGEDYAEYVQNKDYDVTKMAANAFTKNLRRDWRDKE